MTNIQIILLICLLFLTAYVYLRLRTAVVDAILFIGLIAIGIVLVIFPDLTNTIAHKMGIGRGADMIFYFSIIFFGFISLKLYARIRRLEQTLTRLIREDAIREAKNAEK